MEDNHLECIRNQYQENFGTPSLALRFNSDANPVPEAFREPLPEYLDIYIWYPDDKSDLTTIATCGMSSVAFKDVDYRVVNDLYVFSKWYHIKRGECCGNDCQNCPY